MKSHYIPEFSVRTVNEIDICQMGRYHAESWIRAVNDRRPHAFCDPKEVTAQIDIYKDIWQANLREMTQRKDPREGLKAIFYDNALIGFAHFGPVRHPLYQCYSEEWGEVRELVMKEYGWHCAEDLMEHAADHFRHFGMNRFIYHKSHRDPAGDLFYNEMLEKANKVRDMGETEGGRITVYEYEL